MTPPPARVLKVGLWSGMGLVTSNMVGVGVLTSTGYMAGKLGPGGILLAWLAGGLMAMTGAYCYAALAATTSRSGGEYRYISDLFHPALGSMAGWASVLVGFAAPVSLAAATAGPFVGTLIPSAPPLAVGAGLVVVVTAFQAFDRRWSKRTQDALALAKVLLFGAFIAAGVLLGSHEVPVWNAAGTPVTSGIPAGPFAVSLVYVTFAYTGWNAVVYPAEEVASPRRTIPRAMFFGTVAVTLLYLVVNWIFVANLTTDRLQQWLREDTSRITLAHLVIAQIAGPRAAQTISVLVVVALTSTISTMTFLGPRVLSAMAAEGHFPARFVGEEGKPPTLAVLLHSAIALVLLFTHSFEHLLTAVGSILTIISAVAVGGLFRLRWASADDPRLQGKARPGTGLLICGAAYIASSAWMLWYSIAETPHTIVWLAVLAIASLINYRRAARR